MDQRVFVAVNMKHHRASLWYRLRLQFTIYAFPSSFAFCPALLFITHERSSRAASNGFQSNVIKIDVGRIRVELEAVCKT